MKSDKIKGKITEKSKTYKQCADAIGISVTSFSNKLNGSKRFYYDEVCKLSEFLEFTNEEKADIFLL